MAAVTAAVVAGVATVAATGMSVAQSQGAMGGGGGGSSGSPNWKKVPEDPQEKALSDYYGRLTVANADTRYPAFNEYLQSGGDPEKAKMDVQIPGLTPSEMTGLGFTDPQGRPVPSTPQEEALAASETGLSPDKRLFLAQQRRRQAAAQGQQAGPWASRVGSLTDRDKRLENRIAAATEAGQLPRVERLTARHGRVSSKLEKALGGPTEHNV